MKSRFVLNDNGLSFKLIPETEEEKAILKIVGKYSFNTFFLNYPTTYSSYERGTPDSLEVFFKKPEEKSEAPL